MKKNILKLSAFVLALALIIGVCVFANSLVGNPISKLLAKKTALAYIEKSYPNENYELERVSYSFKDGYYHAHLASPDNIDGDFTLMLNTWGKVKLDTYVDRVAGGWNTADRINKDYRKSVDTILSSSSFPYQAHIGFGDIEFISREYKDDPEIPEYAMVTEELTVGAFYNPNEIGAKAGKLTIYIEDETVSIERLSEILLGVKEIFDDAGVCFYAIDCVLEHPKAENGEINDERFEVMDFLYRDIYEEGMTERVSAADQKAKDYYYVLDAEKEKAIEK